MKALFSLRSILQFVVFIALIVVVKLIASAMGYDISGVLGVIIALAGSTLVWWTLEAAKKHKPGDSDA
jgi:Na+-transporting NADH:ubiquinone oxidoreductase subunit NqrD